MNDLSEVPTGGESLASKVGDIMFGLTTWRPEIEMALQHARWAHTFDDITAMVLQGHLTLHAFEDCFALTSITVFPQFKTYHFMLVGGELQSIIKKKPMFESIARELGCKYLSFSGRKGWERALAKHGWEHQFTTMWSEVPV